MNFQQQGENHSELSLGYSGGEGQKRPTYTKNEETNY